MRDGAFFKNLQNPQRFQLPWWSTTLLTSCIMNSKHGLDDDDVDDDDDDDDDDDVDVVV